MSSRKPTYHRFFWQADKGLEALCDWLVSSETGQFTSGRVFDVVFLHRRFEQKELLVLIEAHIEQNNIHL